MSSFIKKRRFIGISKTTPVAEPTTPVLKTVFEVMTERNPALHALIEQLDLEVIGDPTLIEVTPAKVEVAIQEPTVEAGVVAPVNIERLTAVARRAVPENDNLTRVEVIESIASATNVTQLRAENGFALMVAHRILLETPGQTYYLADSIPF